MLFPNHGRCAAATFVADSLLWFQVLVTGRCQQSEPRKDQLLTGEARASKPGPSGPCLWSLRCLPFLSRRYKVELSTAHLRAFVATQSSLLWFQVLATGRCQQNEPRKDQLLAGEARANKPGPSGPCLWSLRCLPCFSFSSLHIRALHSSSSAFLPGRLSLALVLGQPLWLSLARALGAPRERLPGGLVRGRALAFVCCGCQRGQDIDLAAALGFQLGPCGLGSKTFLRLSIGLQRSFKEM